MKYFQKILFIYCLLFSVYAFAHHGKGYRIIAEEQTITPGLRAGIKPLTSLSIIRDNPATALTFSADVTGYPNYETEVFGEHFIFIINETSATQRFEYKQTLAVHGRIIENKRLVEIEPNGMFEDETRTYIFMREREIGAYPVKATTEITGLYNTHSEAYGSITIREKF